jgi:hypothetical protein
MAAIIFPPTPATGDVFPPNPGVAGVSQWEWDGTKWNTVPVFIRSNNQEAYNDYNWPNNIGSFLGLQLTDKLANGVLSWGTPGGPFIYLDDISSQFDGLQNIFTLNEGGQPYTPDPTENLIIVLGGIVQTPGISYTISGPQITFSLAPAPGAAFTAISNLSCPC